MPDDMSAEIPKNPRPDAPRGKEGSAPGKIDVVDPYGLGKLPEGKRAALIDVLEIKAGKHSREETEDIISGKKKGLWLSDLETAEKTGQELTSGKPIIKEEKKKEEETATQQTLTKDDIKEALSEALRKEKERQNAENERAEKEGRRPRESIVTANKIAKLIEGGLLWEGVEEILEDIGVTGPAKEALIRTSRGVLDHNKRARKGQKGTREQSSQAGQERKVESKEKGVEDLSFRELIHKVLREEDEDKLKIYQNEIQRRTKEAEESQFFDRQEIKSRIKSVTEKSSWDTVYPNLVDLAHNAENEARARYGYRDNPQYEGLVETAVLLAAREVQDDGLSRRVRQLQNEGESEDKINEFLKRKLESPNPRVRYEENKKYRDRVQIINYDVLDMAKLVDAEEIRRREAAERGRQRIEELLPPEEGKEAKEEISTSELKPKGSHIAYEGVVPVMEVQKMPSSEQYIEFVNKEKWSDEHFDPRYENNTYYMSLEGEERENFRRRVKLHFAAWTKKRQSWSFEAMIKNSEMMDLSVEDIAALYRTPGVAKALERYVKLLDNDDKLPMGFIDPETGEPAERSLRECTNRDMIDKFRDDIQRKHIKPHLLEEGVSKKNLDVAARDAEQIGFNLAIVSNLFESLDAKWEGTFIGGDPKEHYRYGQKETIRGDYDPTEYTNVKRVRGFKIFQGSTDIMNKPIRTALNPIDALVEMAFRGEKETEVGEFTPWASKQIRKQLRKAGYKGGFGSFYQNKWGGFKEIELINDNEAKNYWKIEKVEGDKDEKVAYKLYAPECYPLRQIGSYWEDASAYDEYKYKDEEGNDKVEYRKKTFLEFIREGKEIPFENAYKTPGFAGYLVDASYWVGVWKLYTEDAGKSFNYNEVLKTLGNAGRRGDNYKSMERWIFYANKGLDPEKRLPFIKMTYQERYSMKGSRLFEDYLPERSLYFRWNRKAENWKQKYQRKGFLPALGRFIKMGIRGPQ